MWKKRKRSFEEAREYVRSLGLKTVADWYRYARSEERPNDIPVKPRGTYSDSWISWADFLGADEKELRQSRTEGARKKWQNPEYRARMSKMSREMWQDPEHRARMSEAISLTQTPEERQRRSVRQPIVIQIRGARSQADRQPRPLRRKRSGSPRDLHQPPILHRRRTHFRQVAAARDLVLRGGDPHRTLRK
jgi:hypothetical protein